MRQVVAISACRGRQSARDTIRRGMRPHLPSTLLVRRPLVVLVARDVGARATPLTIIAPAAPGGGWDQTARAMQRAFAPIEPGDGVQVENVPGAAGTIGLARFVSAERGRPDALLVTGLVMVERHRHQRARGLARRHDADRAAHRRVRGDRRAGGVAASHAAAICVDAFQRDAAARVVGRRIGGRHRRSAGAAARRSRRRRRPPTVNYIAFSGGGEALAAVLGGQVTAGVSGYGEFAQSRSPPASCACWRSASPDARRRHRRADAARVGRRARSRELARGRRAARASATPNRTRSSNRVRQVVASAAWRDDARSAPAGPICTSTAPPFRQFLLAEQARVDAVLRRLDAADRRRRRRRRGRRQRARCRAWPSLVALCCCSPGARGAGDAEASATTPTLPLARGGVARVGAIVARCVAACRSRMPRRRLRADGDRACSWPPAFALRQPPACDATSPSVVAVTPASLGAALRARPRRAAADAAGVAPMNAVRGRSARRLRRSR